MHTKHYVCICINALNSLSWVQRLWGQKVPIKYMKMIIIMRRRRIHFQFYPSHRWLNFIYERILIEIQQRDEAEMRQKEAAYTRASLMSVSNNKFVFVPKSLSHLCERQKKKSHRTNKPPSAQAVPGEMSKHKYGYIHATIAYFTDRNLHLDLQRLSGCSRIVRRSRRKYVRIFFFFSFFVWMPLATSNSTHRFSFSIT